MTHPPPMDSVPKEKDASNSDPASHSSACQIIGMSNKEIICLPSKKMLQMIQIASLLIRLPLSRRIPKDLLLLKRN